MYFISRPSPPVPQSLAFGQINIENKFGSFQLSRFDLSIRIFALSSSPEFPLLQLFILPTKQKRNKKDNPITWYQTERKRGQGQRKNSQAWKVIMVGRVIPGKSGIRTTDHIPRNKETLIPSLQKNDV